jgi:hypothetical protein
MARSKVGLSAIQTAFTLLGGRFDMSINGNSSGLVLHNTYDALLVVSSTPDTYAKASCS